MSHLYQLRQFCDLDQRATKFQSSQVILQAPHSPRRGVSQKAGCYLQPFGLLHGGANVVLTESLGSVGTHLHAGPTRRIVGIEINASHHKSATSGIVTAVATAVTLGKTLCTYNVEITNDKGEKTCTARITCLILAER